MEPEEPEISGEHWARIQDVEGYTSVYPQLSTILISMNLVYNCIQDVGPWISHLPTKDYGSASLCLVIFNVSRISKLAILDGMFTVRLSDHRIPSMSSIFRSYSELNEFQPYDRSASPEFSFLESGLYPRQGEEVGDNIGDTVLENAL